MKKIIKKGGNRNAIITFHKDEIREYNLQEGNEIDITINTKGKKPTK